MCIELSIALFFFNNRSYKMKIWKRMKWIYDFSQNTKLLELTFWLSSKEMTVRGECTNVS